MVKTHREIPYTTNDPYKKSDFTNTKSLILFYGQVNMALRSNFSIF